MRGSNGSTSGPGPGPTPWSSPTPWLDSFDRLVSGGWAWIPGENHRIVWQAPGESVPRSVPLPPWYEIASALRVSPDGRQLAFYGVNHTLDSLRFQHGHRCPAVR